MTFDEWWGASKYADMSISKPITESYREVAESAWNAAVDSCESNMKTAIKHAAKYVTFREDA